MPRYIDADLVNFEDVTDTVCQDQAYKAVEAVPTADVVEVVRCKDCKYASPNGEYGCKAYHFKLYETHEMKADDFCSRGERHVDGAGRDIYGNIKRADNAANATQREDLPQNDDPFDEWGGA